MLALSVNAQSGTVLSHQKISSTQGNFNGSLRNGSIFGQGLANIGDLNGDGIDELAVGAQHGGIGAERSGAVWILFMNSDGTVKTSPPSQKIANGSGGFAGSLFLGDNFGNDITGIGDLDGDGVQDIAVGNAFRDDGGRNRGAVWILYMKNDGTVDRHQVISSTDGGFTGLLRDGGRFGTSVNFLGDLNGDGFIELAVGAGLDDDGGTNKGAVWILSLNPNGTVRTHLKISET
ncbi:MAG: FG-GAP repeat protein, partial [Flavobacteriales bacterium]|nr:FG-GAP repeat protein [Flavobacteriales bacterium]